jgi:signal transduction histidine kinase
MMPSIRSVRIGLILVLSLITPLFIEAFGSSVDDCTIVVDVEENVPNPLPKPVVDNKIRVSWGQELNLGVIPNSVVCLRGRYPAKDKNVRSFLGVTRSKSKSLHLFMRDSAGKLSASHARNIFGIYGFVIDGENADNFFIRIVPVTNSDIILSRLPLESFGRSELGDQYFDLIIIAFLVFMGIGSGISSFVLKERVLIFYSAYSFFGLLVVGYISNFDDFFLDVVSARTLILLGISAHFLCAIVLLQYVRMFLNTQKYAPTMHRLIWLPIGLGIIGIVCAPISITYAQYMVTVVGLVGGPMIGLTTYKIFKQSAEGYIRVYLVSWLIFATFIVLYCLRLLGLQNTWLRNLPIHNHELQVGMAIEMTLLSLAMIMKAKRMATDKEVMRREFDSRAKASSLMTLAAGVAHEINNPLSILKAIVSNLRFMNEKKTVDKNSLIDSIFTIDSTVERIADIVKSMNYLTKSDSQTKFQLVSQQKFLESTLRICGSKFDSNLINLGLDLLPESTEVYCNDVQLSQVVLNLLLNAIDAVKSSEQHKWIRVRTSFEGQNYRLEVSNGGSKIDLNILHKIFDPFFSTKPVGEGCGLGLAISQTIIEAHRGKIFVDVAAENTKFVILIPKNPVT